MDKILNKPKFKLFLILLITTVVVAGLVGFAVNKFFGKPQDGKNINSFMPDQLTLGSSFTLDEVIEYMQYEPLWIKTDGIEVQLYAEKNTDGDSALEENKELISYDTASRTFMVNGVGTGKIQITSEVDSTVFLELPFETKFRSNNTKSILKDNYPQFFADNIVTDSEIQSVTEIKLQTANSMNLIDFSSCTKLERVVLTTSKDIVLIEGLEALNSQVEFLVYGEFYYDYIQTDVWSKYYERIFPIVKLESNENSVVFEFNGGTMERVNKSDSSYFDSITSGTTIVLSDYAIKKEGYTFLGWYTSSDKGVTYATKITEDYVFDKNTKLYANWSVNEYDVSYNDRFVSEIPDMQHVKYDEQFQISSFIPSRTGYTFLGWATEENSLEVVYLPGATVQKLTSIDNDVINLYGVWAANNYTIKYHANGGSNAPSPQENLAYGDDVQLSSQKPGRTGYAFIGWSTNQNDTDYQYVPGATVKNLISDSDGVVTLYAIWAANDYSIQYNANGGSNAPVAQENLKYGDTVVLTSEIPQRVGYVFLGWSKSSSAVEPELLPGASVKNLVSTSGGEVTLYAVWELATFYLTYDANGGQDAPDNDVLTYKTASSVATSTPTREGYTFRGWSIVKDGELTYTSGALLDEAAVNSLYSAPTLYAVWEVNYYTITVNSTGEKGGSVSGVTNGGLYAYGTYISISASYNGDESKYMQVDGSSVGNSYSFYMPAHNVTITVHSDQSDCVASGTMITLSDGTHKKVEDLSEADELLVFNHETGTYVSAPILFIERDGWKNYRVINLTFSNGQTTKIIDEHAFFDLTLNEYVYIDEDNYLSYVGHMFATENESSGYSVVILENAYITEEYIGCYSLITAYHMNYFVDGLFSIPGGIGGLFNIFEYDENLAYNTEKMQSDISTYGLYTYDDFAEYVPYEVFEYMFPAKYFKIAVGKGMITYEEILELIDYYLVKHGFI